MIALYVASLAEGEGKTALCAGLGSWFQEKGNKVGYLKPLRTAQSPDKDAAFLRQNLSLEEPVEQLAPLSLDEAKGSSADFGQKVQTACATVFQGKDVIILEGTGGLAQESVATQTSLKLTELLKAKVLLVARYGDSAAASIQAATSKLGDHFLGVVINAVPPAKLAKAKELASVLQSKGIKVLGVLPQHRSLYTVTVSEMAEHLKGKQLVPVHNSGGLVENLMMGALSPDSGLLYYGRKGNKAVLIRGDRADMQLAALETSTRCLVLTGGKSPMPFVIAEAKNKGVPIISTQTDNSTVIEQTEALLNQTRFHQEEKLGVIRSLMAQHFDFEYLSSSLGFKA